LKINLSSAIFTSVPVTQGIPVKVTDSGANPVSGARVELDGKTVFTNTNGIAYIKVPSAGNNSVSVTKTGYAAYSGTIALNGTQQTVILTADAGAMPDKVYFGKYSGSPIKWRVLDVDLTAGKALLFADTALFQHTLFGSDNIWRTSNLRTTLNDATSGFLQASNFTAGEYAAILQTQTETGVTDRAFALSSPEARLYMPDNAMRPAAQSVWLRNLSSNVTADMTVTVQWTQNSTGSDSSSGNRSVDYTAASAFKWYTQAELEAAIRSGPPARTRYSGSTGGCG